MNTRILIGLFCFSHLGQLSAAGWLHGSPSMLNAQLDIDRSGKLEEIEVLLGLKNELLGQPYNLSAMRDKKEIPKPLREELEKEFKTVGPNKRPSELRMRYDDLIRQYSDRKPPYALDKMDPREFGLKTRAVLGPSDLDIAAKPVLSRWNFQIRRSKEDLDIPIDGDFDTYEQGALVSYGRDFESKRDSWTLKGVTALSYNMWMNPDYDPTLVASAGKTAPQPSDALVEWRTFDARLLTTFDRLDVSNGGDGEVNSLKWGLGIKAEAGFRETTAGMNSFAFALAAVYDTDFDFKKEIVGGEFDLYPIFALWGCASYGDLWRYRNRYGKETSAFYVRWTPYLHAEGGRVEAAGSSKGVRAYDNFGRVGGGVLVEIVPLADWFDRRLSIQASYYHYEGLSEHVDSAHVFHATAQYVLPIGTGVYEPTLAEGVEGHSRELRQRDLLVTFRVEYTNGEKAFSQERENSLLFGIGVAF